MMMCISSRGTYIVEVHMYIYMCIRGDRWTSFDFNHALLFMSCGQTVHAWLNEVPMM